MPVHDAHGGSDSCSTTVTVADTQPPMVTCSATAVGDDDDEHDGDDDHDEQRLLISYSALDQCGAVTGSAVIETPCCPVPVSDGQIVKVKCAEHEECKLKLDFKHGMLKIKSSNAALAVTETDECGNTATCTVDICAPGGP